MSAMQVPTLSISKVGSWGLRSQRTLKISRRHTVSSIRFDSLLLMRCEIIDSLVNKAAQGWSCRYTLASLATGLVLPRTPRYHGSGLLLGIHDEISRPVSLFISGQSPSQPTALLALIVFLLYCVMKLVGVYIPACIAPSPTWSLNQ